MVHLTALLTGVTLLAHATKPALMPLLAAHVLLRGGPPLLAGALLLGCGGDTLLQVGGDTVFLLGMASFAAGHVCYLLLFARHGSPGGARTYRLAALYTAAWLTVVVLLWPGLDGELRVPVALYSLLLTAMALGATRARLWAGAGGALFLLSDTLLASGLAKWPQAPAPQFWVMLTYLAAQGLLAHGVLRCHAEPGHAEPEGPGRRTEEAGPRSAGPSAGPGSDQSRTAASASTTPKP
ncbi:lysoplasmalogenase [Streptomyces sp. DSM 40473]|uniref:Lysoplasmalogenase n=1 Tax=Streptomyces hesseae TaxID=3075519 RepID=A0ABU2SWU5_9ACTN|nr:lysoplasmalogenase [Streptomyces sp. DSM 40473]MDT0453474.1 lysoplasmalogenase [Streptomyces sp. DSM 40473]